MTAQSPKRVDFLYWLLVTAINHDGYGFFDNEEFITDGRLPDANVCAVIRDRLTGTQYRVAIDTMAKGLGVLRTAERRTIDGDEVRVNAKTGQRLFFAGHLWSDLMTADVTNGDDGDYDVIGALAVLECALFGYVKYA